MDLLDVFRPNIARLREREDREALIRALDYRRDAAVRRGAVKALGEAADPALLDHLAGALGDTDEGVRYEAVEALVRLKDPRAVGPLSASLRDPDSDVRFAAAWSLGEIGDTAAAGPLVEALGDESLEGPDRDPPRPLEAGRPSGPGCRGRRPRGRLLARAYRGGAGPRCSREPIGRGASHCGSRRRELEGQEGGRAGPREPRVGEVHGTARPGCRRP